MPTLKTRKRKRNRDQNIRRIGRVFDRWAVRLAQRTAGIVAAGRGGREGVSGSLDVLFIGATIDASAVMEKELRKLWSWSWQSAVGAWMRGVPKKVWDLRLTPILTLVGESVSLIEQSYEEFVFQPLSEERINEILSATNAPDGLSAMQRIRTVAGKDLGRLKETIITAFSGSIDEASSVQAAMPRIREMVDGVNYKAQRIARTEGTRIAEAAMRESWEPVQDMMIGVRTFTSDDENVRESHRHWHDKLYYQITPGQYQAKDGEVLPEFPAGPNCRCWSTPELRDDLV
jgi:hypothetical protein